MSRIKPDNTPLQGDGREEWIFSLNLPFPEQKVIQLKADHDGTSSLERTSPAPTETMDDDQDQANQEMESLLCENYDKSFGDCCWRFQSPKGRTLESKILLKLSYRPGWQGIPEYTSTLRRRKVLNALSRCTGCRSPRESDPEQIWEVYSTKDIIDMKQRFVSIRGMGRCKAISIYLKPLNPYEEREDKFTVPTKYENAWKSHHQRMGKGDPEASAPKPWSRFTEPGDSLPPLGNEKRIVITFALPVETETKYDPPLLWKVQLPQRYREGSSSSIIMDTITLFDGTVNLKEPTTHVYINGYQSWSFTGSVWKGQPQPKPAMPNVFSHAFNHGGSPPSKPNTVAPSTNKIDYQKSAIEASSFYKSDFFSCVSSGRGKLMDEDGGPALLCGWISQHEQLGTIGLSKDLSRVSMHATHKAQMNVSGIQTDWAYAQIISPHHYDEEPMVHFLHTTAAYNQARPLQNGPLLTGWCSWYHYYENISAGNLRSNFAKLAAMRKKVPTNVSIVDDGYMTAWGDWDSLKPKKFDDMSIVARDIISYGMRSGIWLAPFACDKHSKVAKMHPEWIIRNDRGVPANSSNCGKFFYGLDATNPNVREHVRESIHRAVRDWGFQVLKIDFLYAACLEGNGKYDPTMTRAQAMHLALKTIREAAGPDVFLIGCGCPLGGGIGYVDGMRISADTGPTWLPAFPLPKWDHGTLPALRAMIRNSMTRAPLGHRWWHNDPDCLLLGESTGLTNLEVASAASIVAMTCGMMLLSDDLTKVSSPRMEILTKIFPMTGVSATVLDLHTTKNEGLPSIMRLWCTDRYNALETFRKSDFFGKAVAEFKENASATHFGRDASFRLNAPMPHPNERKRSCIPVARGLGTWTMISLSNWANKPRVMEIPHMAVEPPPISGWGTLSSAVNATAAAKTINTTSNGISAGYHVFSFWSSKYSWVSLEDTATRDCSDSDDEERITDSRNMNCMDSVTITGLRRRLGPHETEIFHIRPVTPDVPQYIGSDIHFSCGHEVLQFVMHLNTASLTASMATRPVATISPSSPPKIQIQLQHNLHRLGHIFVFLPVVDTRHIQVRTGNHMMAVTPTAVTTPINATGIAIPWTTVANVPSTRPGSTLGSHPCIGRIVKIEIEIHGDGSPQDGWVQIDY